MEFRHTSVMLSECIEMLKVVPGGTYVDGTLGGGGHTCKILAASAPTGISIGLDKDEEALCAAKEKCASFSDRLITIHGDFMKMAELIPSDYIGNIDGVLLDLGVSSYQLDSSERGFSYMNTGRLDMRMDRQQTVSAFEIVNGYSKEQLTKVFYSYGEEKWSSRIADFIVKARESSAIEDTQQLVDIIKAAIPASARRTGPHPAARVFQAIRIEVNGELERLGQSMQSIVSIMKDGGRLCVITFHSLEDRIIKQAFKKLEDPCECPKKAPCVCGKKPLGKIITKKPMLPSGQEIDENPRSRSAKLRVFEKMCNTH